MASYEVVHGAPVLAIDNADGSIIYAAAVLGRWTVGDKAFIHVRTWEAGLGERNLDLTPSEFSTWRRSFTRPEVVN